MRFINSANGEQDLFSASPNDYKDLAYFVVEPANHYMDQTLDVEPLDNFNSYEDAVKFCDSYDYNTYITLMPYEDPYRDPETKDDIEYLEQLKNKWKEFKDRFGYEPYEVVAEFDKGGVSPDLQWADKTGYYDNINSSRRNNMIKSDFEYDEEDTIDIEVLAEELVKEGYKADVVESVKDDWLNDYNISELTSDEERDFRKDVEKQSWLDSSRKPIKSDKLFRLIDTEHDDPKDGEDFTAEELRNYISENDEYFDNVGLDYTIVDLDTGEEMNISTFRLNSSRQIKSEHQYGWEDQNTVLKATTRGGRYSVVVYDTYNDIDKYWYKDGYSTNYFDTPEQILAHLVAMTTWDEGTYNNIIIDKLGIGKQYLDICKQVRQKYGWLEKFPEGSRERRFYFEITRVISSWLKRGKSVEEIFAKIDEALARQNLNSSRKPIKSAIDGGWEVRSSDVPEALDLFVEHYGEETALEEIAKSMGTDTLLENVEWIAQQWGFGEDLEDIESAWDKYEYAKEIMGVSELFTNLTQAAGYDELAEDLAFIFRQYDFREWNKYDNEEDIYSSRKIQSGVYGEVDPAAVEDLYLTIINDSELYEDFIRPVINNLKKHNRRGLYDNNKALISWMRVADEGAKKYDKQFGSGRGSVTMFSPATRKEVANKLMEYYEENVMEQ